MAAVHMGHLPMCARQAALPVPHMRKRMRAHQDQFRGHVRLLPRTSENAKRIERIPPSDSLIAQSRDSGSKSYIDIGPQKFLRGSVMAHRYSQQPFLRKQIRRLPLAWTPSASDHIDTAPITPIDEFMDPVDGNLRCHRDCHPAVPGQPCKAVWMNKPKSQGRISFFDRKFHFQQNRSRAKCQSKEDLVIVTICQAAPQLSLT